LTRYRKSSLPEPDMSPLGPLRKEAEKVFLWMPDGKGNLVKKEASTVKKGFAKLSSQAQIALTEYLIRVQNKVPTDASRRTLFNSIVDGAVAAYKEGKKETPWDVLGILMENSPALDNQNVSYVQYDKITSDALLNQIADSIGFNPALITEQDRNDFLKKINEQAKAGGRTSTRQVTGGGVETITTPAVFNAKDFTQNYLWAKVNIQDTQNLPTSVINQIASIRNVLKDNGIDLSDPEVAKISLDISSGKKNIDTIKAEFSDMAAKMYPQLAERLKATPGLTVRQAVTPVLSNIAKAWEVNVDDLDINDPRIDQLIRPDGILGKEPPKTNYDAYQWAVNQPEFESTSTAINKAQEAALSLAKAMGWGI
jgi:hypothetical protein